MSTCTSSTRHSASILNLSGLHSRNCEIKVRHVRRMLTTGLAKNIGVANFRIVDLERVLKIAKHKPVVNQIEFHPYLQQNKLRQYLSEHDIIPCAYSPLMPLTTKKDGPLTAVIEKIAKKQ